MLPDAAPDAPDAPDAGDDPSLLDAVRVGQERALAATVGPDDRPHRAGELPDRGPEVQAQLRERGSD